MNSGMMDKRNFFISYTSTDENWAKWVAFILSLHSKTYYVQFRDSVAGRDFTEWMFQAIDLSENFIFIWSRAYAEDGYYAQLEFKHAQEKQKEEYQKNHHYDFLPLRVDNYKTREGYEALHYIDLTKLSESDAVRKLCSATGYNGTPIEPVPFPNLEYADNLCRLGEFYSDGLFPVEKSTHKMIKYFEQAEKSGSATAYARMGKYFEMREENFQEAFENYRIAATKGYVVANIELGRLYRTGFGGTKRPDYDTALRYYERIPENSLDREDPEKLLAYGFFFDNGFAGFQKDDSKACEYYSYAVNAGNREALLYLSDFWPFAVWCG